MDAEESVVAGVLGGAAMLLAEIRFEHREVLGETWVAWLPIAYAALLLVAGSAALVRFRCTAGIAPLPPQPPLNKADVYVLVDGQSRYERRQFQAVDGPFAVDVPLAQQDRFLTLATTDGGDTIGHDYVLWGDPLLEIQD